MADEVDPLRLARQIADSYRGATDPLPDRPRRRRRRPTSSRPYREDPQDVAGVLDSFIENQGWTKRLAVTRVFSDWERLVGPDIANHCTVEHFEDGVVHVRASSTAWAKELTMLAPRVVARLNDELGDGTVLRLQIRGPAAPSWSRGPRSVKGRGPRDTYG